MNLKEKTLPVSKELRKLYRKYYPAGAEYVDWWYYNEAFKKSRRIKVFREYDEVTSNKKFMKKFKKFVKKNAGEFVINIEPHEYVNFYASRQEHKVYTKTTVFRIIPKTT